MSGRAMRCSWRHNQGAQIRIRRKCAEGMVGATRKERYGGVGGGSGNAVAHLTWVIEFKGRLWKESGKATLEDRMPEVYKA